MDRDGNLKHIPFCPTRIEKVDAYSWSEPDPLHHDCVNGWYHQIYECNGNINYQLPLDMYPKVNRVSPEISMTGADPFIARDPVTARMVARTQKDIDTKRLEGLYFYGASYNPYKYLPYGDLYYRKFW
jgi:hypothetical protein